jgi:GT2 family glycosyltransferase
MVAVDLLVVSYNTKDKLKRLVETLNSDYEDFVWNLHIRDNGSTDGSVELLHEMWQDPDRYRIYGIDTGENIGYARAINWMVAHSCGADIIAAVNADTWFTTKHVKQVIKTFEDNPNQAIMGPKQMDEMSVIRHGGILWWGRKGGANPLHRGWSQADPQDILFKDRIRCWTVSGSLYYVRRSVWNELTNCPKYQEFTGGAEGAFLPTPHYFEETFCSVHAQKHGHEVWYDGTVETAGHSWDASAPIGVPSKNYFQISQGMYVQACEALEIEHEC